MKYIVLPILLLLLTGFAFYDEFSPSRHVYDNAGVLLDNSIQASLAAMANQHNIWIYLVTTEDILTYDKVIENTFKQENIGQGEGNSQTDIEPEPQYPEIVDTEPQNQGTADDSSQNQGPVGQSGDGTILTYSDVQCSDLMGPCENAFLSTGFEPCWPERGDELNWRAIWEEHACMSFPETFERIQINYEFLDKEGEGWYEVAIPTNAYLGEVYKNSENWMFKDRDGYDYTLAPLNSNHPVYNSLNEHYNNPEYSVSSVRTTTLSLLLHEKYGSMRRLKGGSVGYPTVSCTGDRITREYDYSVNEGENVELAGIPKCEVLIAYANSELTVMENNCGEYHFSNTAYNPEVESKIKNGEVQEAIKTLIEQMFKIVDPTSKNPCSDNYHSASNLLEENKFIEAKEMFKDVYDSCSGEIKFRAMLNIASIDFDKQEYFMSNIEYNTVYQAATGEIKHSAWKGVIKSASAKGDCDNVIKTIEENDYQLDEEINSIFNECQETGQSGKTEIIEEFLEKDEDTRILITEELGQGWQYYNQNRFKEAEKAAYRILSVYFTLQPSNFENYPNLVKDVTGLLYQAGFKVVTSGQASEHQTCKSVTTNYLEKYVSKYGINENIEKVKDECSDVANTVIFADNGLCALPYPNSIGPLINRGFFTMHSCEIFETGTDKMDWAIDLARNCCKGNGQSGVCKFARDNSNLVDNEQNLKRCMGIYLIGSLGNFAYEQKWMNDYYQAEINCYNYAGSGVEPEYAGQCNSRNSFLFSEAAKVADCSIRDKPWSSDTDWRKNTCFMANPPAHASLNVLKTGTCLDYSVVVTTLLRRAGYFVDEVFSVKLSVVGYKIKHAANLVKLPGDSKFHYVDTVGGMGGIKFNGKWPNTLIPRSFVECLNDKGVSRCPSLSEIYEYKGESS